MESLPAELREAIVSYIIRPTDLKSLCLTSKQLQAIATPFLYWRTILDLNTWEQNAGFFQPGHPGHQHIRRLVFLPIFNIDASTARVQWAMRTALQLLPPDTLEGFETAHNVTINPKTLDLLYKKQRNLKMISLGPIFDGLGGNSCHPSKWLTDLKFLDVGRVIGSEKDLDFYGEVIKTGENLRHLVIRPHCCINTIHAHESVRGSGIFNDRKGYGGIFNRLFGHLEDDVEGYSPKLILDAIWLEYMCLVGVERNLASLVRFDLLQDLQLHACDRTGPFLEALTKQFAAAAPAVQLRTFVYESSEIGWGVEEAPISVIQDFLRSFSSLRFLRIQYQLSEEGGFDVGSISRHLRTLTHLYIAMGVDHHCNDEPWTMALPDARRFFAEASSLSQVALTLPEVQLDDTTYGVHGDFAAFIDELHQLRHLEVLHILNWPRPTKKFKNDFREELIADIKLFSNEVVRRIVHRYEPIHESKLKLLAIGRSEWLGSVRDTKGHSWLMNECPCFLVQTEPDETGRTVAVAKPLDRHHVKFEVPTRVEVSNFGEGNKGSWLESKMARFHGNMI